MPFKMHIIILFSRKPEKKLVSPVNLGRVQGYPKRKYFLFGLDLTANLGSIYW